MLRHVLLLCASGAAHAGTVDVTVTDCCTAACKGTIKTIDNPGTCPSPGDCKSGGSGSLNVDVTDAKMELTLNMGGVKVLDKTTDACGHMDINLPLGLGSVGIDALAACPAKAGPITVKIDVTNKIALPSKVTSHSVTKDQDGNELLCLDLTFTPQSAAVAPAARDHVAERQSFVNELNALPGMTWRAGVNPRFHGTPIGSSKPLCGVKEGHKAMIDAAVAEGRMERVEATGAALPTDFDSATAFPQCAKVINDIRDQSNCGCCWAFGPASAASDRMCIGTNASVIIPLSAQDLCFCSSSNGCGGGFPASALDYVKSSGIVSGNQQSFTGSGTDPDPFAGAGYCSKFSLPHCHHHGPTGKDPFPSEGAAGCPSESSPKCPSKCDSDAKAPHNTFSKDKYSFTGSVASYSSADAIAQTLVSGGPVACAFTVYSDFENYAGGVYEHKSGSQLGGHAVRIVGFGVGAEGTAEAGVKYWKVANSWNPYWGENGYFRIVRGTNNCGIEDEVVGVSHKAKWVTP